MSVKMTDDRISRWKCIFCGSKKKKKINALNANDEIMGYSLMCCNCGHIDNFALTNNAALTYICGMKQGLKNIDFTCGLAESDMCLCDDVNCPNRKKTTETSQNPSTIVPDNTKQDMTLHNGKKYQ